jgi:hypothetical protein
VELYLQAYLYRQLYIYSVSFLTKAISPQFSEFLKIISFNYYDTFFCICGYPMTKPSISGAYYRKYEKYKDPCPGRDFEPIIPA